MKRFVIVYLSMFLFFAITFTGVNIFLNQDLSKSEKSRNVIVNRLSEALQQEFLIESDMNKNIEQVFYHKMDDYRNEYKDYEIPKDICFVGVSDKKMDLRLAESSDKRISVIKNSDDETEGFLVFMFDISSYKNMILYVNIGMAICAFLLFSFMLYIHLKVLRPFHKMSTYPEILSKGEITEKLQESKNKYFGRFIWGINMLGDKLSGDKKRINKLMQERQVLLTTIAHGIKTPVANIKLYASAIETGLYKENGIPDKEDAIIAAKIDKNADDITVLVKEMIETSATGMVDFQACPAKFYVKEIVAFINQEYSNRFKMLHIPYQINCQTQALIDTDQSGVTRILSQMLDNAIKYGDGQGICITIEKQEEGFFFSVKNKGQLISEREIPFIFNSFWRGSNAEQVEGSGIGMFESRRIAKILGGDIYVKRYEASSEMEFILYIPS